MCVICGCECYTVHREGYYLAFPLLFLVSECGQAGRPFRLLFEKGRWFGTLRARVGCTHSSRRFKFRLLRHQQQLLRTPQSVAPSHPSSSILLLFYHLFSSPVSYSEPLRAFYQFSCHYKRSQCLRDESERVDCEGFRLRSRT